MRSFFRPIQRNGRWSTPDPRLNKILVKVCEETLSTHESNTSAFRTKVENIISSSLPHGHARAEIVARKLGVSERTLARRLAQEGVTFIEVLQQLKASLATRYLDEGQMPISKIAWLLGFEEVSSFSHACRRWLGEIAPRAAVSLTNCGSRSGPQSS